MSVYITVDHDDLARVQKKLGSMSAKAPRAVRDAVNHTATTARVRLLRAAQQRYTVKAGGFKSDAQITRATLATLTAWIRSKGSTLPVTSYHATHPKSGVKAEVVKGSGLKPIVNSDGIKAFMAKGVVFQRRGNERLPIKGIRSPSVPKQIEVVYDGRAGARALKQEIDKLYKANIDKQIRRMLEE